jgi:putative ABC transport system permease protein
MVKKAFLHSVFSLYKEQLGRFIALIGVSLVGIGFMSGLGQTKDKLEVSMSNYYRSNNLSDLTIISSQETGFSSSELDTIKNEDKVSSSETYFFYEKTFKEKEIYRFYLGNDDDTLNKLTLTSGVLPSKSDEALALKEDGSIVSHKLGDKVTGLFGEVSIVGLVTSPEFTYYKAEPSYSDSKVNLSGVIFLSPKIRDTMSSYLINNAVHVSLTPLEDDNVYNKEYLQEVKDVKANLVSKLNNEKIKVLTLEENAGKKALGSYAQKVQDITYILSIFFIAVVGLVIASTLSRLIEEERSTIATYISLGVSRASIAAKYMIFALLALIIGASIGHFLVGNALVYFIYSAFSLAFNMPAMTSASFSTFGLIAACICIGISLISTGSTLASSLNEKPAALLVPKTPKVGKKLFLEHFPKAWKRLSFTSKSVLRNLFRHPIRFLMTIVTVGGSAVLLVASFGLLDSSIYLNDDSTALLSSISGVLLGCAIALSVIVLYNLTNISLSERRREIATLMVLGYTDSESGTYVFRDVTIMVIVGIIVGLPFGYLFANFVFTYVDYGSITYMNWYSWLIVVGIELACSLLSDILLYPHVKKTDMNASLKAVE